MLPWRQARGPLCLLSQPVHPAATPRLISTPPAFLVPLAQHEQDILRAAKVATQLDWCGLSSAALGRMFGEPSAELLAAQAQAPRLLQSHVEDEALPPLAVLFGIGSARWLTPFAARAFVLLPRRRLAQGRGVMPGEL